MKKLLILIITVLMLHSCGNQTPQQDIIDEDIFPNGEVFDIREIKKDIEKNVLQNFRIIPSDNDDIRGGKIIGELHDYVQEIRITRYLNNQEHKKQLIYTSGEQFYSERNDDHNRSQNIFDYFGIGLQLGGNSDFGMNKYLIEAYTDGVKLGETTLENGIEICNGNIKSTSELHQILDEGYGLQKLSFYEDQYYVVSHKKTGNKQKYGSNIGMVDMKFDLLDCNSKQLTNIFTQDNRPQYAIGLGDMSENSTQIIKKIDNKLFFTYFHTSEYDAKYAYDFDLNKLYDLDLDDMLNKESFQIGEKGIYFSTLGFGEPSEIFLFDNLGNLKSIYKHDFFHGYNSLTPGDISFSGYEIQDSGGIELILSEYIGEENFKEIRRELK